MGSGFLLARGVGLGSRAAAVGPRWGGANRFALLSDDAASKPAFALGPSVLLQTLCGAGGETREFHAGGVSEAEEEDAEAAAAAVGGYLQQGWRKVQETPLTATSSTQTTLPLLETAAGPAVGRAPLDDMAAVIAAALPSAGPPAPPPPSPSPEASAADVDGWAFGALGAGANAEAEARAAESRALLHQQRAASAALSARVAVLTAGGRDALADRHGRPIAAAYGDLSHRQRVRRILEAQRGTAVSDRATARAERAGDRRRVRNRARGER